MYACITIWNYGNRPWWCRSKARSNYKRYRFIIIIIIISGSIIIIIIIIVIVIVYDPNNNSNNNSNDNSNTNDNNSRPSRPGGRLRRQTPWTWTSSSSRRPSLGEGLMGSALMGSLRRSCFLTEGLLWGTPVWLLVVFPKVPGCTFVSNLSSSSSSRRPSLLDKQTARELANYRGVDLNGEQQQTI